MARLTHSTVYRWVIRLTPLPDNTFRRYKRLVGRRWRMDETYIKVKGQWKYLCRAVDFLLTARRDAAAALRFFRKAFRQNGTPEVVTIDSSTASRAALAVLSTGRAEAETFAIRQSRYLNNLVEQDHRNIKRRIKLLAGFKPDIGRNPFWLALN